MSTQTPELLRKYIALKGLSLTKVCQLASISYSMLHKYLNSKGDLNSKNLMKVLNSLGFNVDTNIQEEINNICTGKKSQKIIKEELYSLYEAFQNVDPLMQKAFLSLLMKSVQMNNADPGLLNSLDKMNQSIITLEKTS